MTDSSDSLSSHRHYHRDYSLENFALFHANLQNFSLQVTYICGLETNGKLSPEVAYNKIRELWKQLKQSKKQLGD